MELVSCKTHDPISHSDAPPTLEYETQPSHLKLKEEPREGEKGGGQWVGTEEGSQWYDPELILSYQSFNAESRVR